MEEKIINITEEELELEDYLDMRIAVRAWGDSVIKNDKMLIFVSDCALDEWADKNHFYDVSELPIRVMTFGSAVSYALKSKVSGIEILGFYDDTSFISANELKKASSLVQNYMALEELQINPEKQSRICRQIRENEVYIHGTLPNDYKEGDRFGTETMKREKDGTEYTAVPVFLSERSALKQNPNDAPVNKCKFCDVAFMYRTMFKIIVEPYKRYYHEFEPDDIL